MRSSAVCKQNGTALQSAAEDSPDAEDATMVQSWKMLCVCCAVLTTCVLATGVRAAAPAAKAPTVEVRGLRVVAAGYGDGMRGLRAFNWSKGVTLALLVQIPDGGIIDLDDDASKLDKFTDDKGTNLLVGGDTWGKVGIGGFASISKDGKACLAELNGKSVPIKGATQVWASGTLVLKCASKKKTVQHKKIALKKGTKIPGAIPFTIDKVGKPDWGDAALQVTLAAKQDLSSVAEIKFFDAQGKEIESSSAGSSSMRMGPVVNIKRSFNLKKKATNVTIAVTYWTDMRIVKLPFNVKTGVGM
jgi:hypothetical protein